MRVRYSRRARADLDDIEAYLLERSPLGAANVLRAILASIEIVVDHPYAAERTDDPEVRVKIVPRYGYRIFYGVGGDTIELLHVRHGARQPWPGGSIQASGADDDAG
jgi:plasmid stabilization system protein ParE